MVIVMVMVVIIIYYCQSDLLKQLWYALLEGSYFLNKNFIYSQYFENKTHIFLM